MHLFVTRFHYFIQALEQLSRVSILIVCLLDTTEEAQRQCQNVSNSENELSRSTYLDIFARRPTPKKIFERILMNIIIVTEEVNT